MAHETVKSALESLLFVWGEPLEAKTAAELFDMPAADMVEVFRDLAKDYNERGGGLMIREMDKAFQLCTNPVNDDYITRLCTPVKEKKLSQAALEVLAIVAYKQPVSRSEIDAIRGVKSERVLEGLIKRQLVEEKGRSASIGRPVMYGTTREFLRLFGFESVKDLPEIEDVDTLLTDPDQLSIPIEALSGIEPDDGLYPVL